MLLLAIAVSSICCYGDLEFLLDSSGRNSMSVPTPHTAAGRSPTHSTGTRCRSSGGTPRSASRRSTLRPPRLPGRVSRLSSAEGPTDSAPSILSQFRTIVSLFCEKFPAVFRTEIVNLPKFFPGAGPRGQAAAPTAAGSAFRPGTRRRPRPAGSAYRPPPAGRTAPGSERR